jgi:hypothetical protein
MRQSVKPQLASWDRAGHPSQVKLARFLAHVDAIAGPVLATVSGRVAAELIVGFSDGAVLIDGGHVRMAGVGGPGFPVRVPSRHAEQRQLVQCGWRVNDAVRRLHPAQREVLEMV